MPLAHGFYEDPKAYINMVKLANEGGLSRPPPRGWLALVKAGAAQILPATSSTRHLSPSFMTWHPMTWRAISAITFACHVIETHFEPSFLEWLASCDVVRTSVWPDVKGKPGSRPCKCTVPAGRQENWFCGVGRPSAKRDVAKLWAELRSS